MGSEDAERTSVGGFQTRTPSLQIGLAVRRRPVRPCLPRDLALHRPPLLQRNHVPAMTLGWPKKTTWSCSIEPRRPTPLPVDPLPTLQTGPSVASPPRSLSRSSLIPQILFAPPKDEGNACFNELGDKPGPSALCARPLRPIAIPLTPHVSPIFSPTPVPVRHRRNRSPTAEMLWIYPPSTVAMGRSTPCGPDLTEVHRRPV